MPLAWLCLPSTAALATVPLAMFAFTPAWRLSCAENRPGIFQDAGLSTGLCVCVRPTAPARRLHRIRVCAPAEKVTCMSVRLVLCAYRLAWTVIIATVVLGIAVLLLV